MFQDIWPQNNTLRLYPQQVSLQQSGTRHLQASAELSKLFVQELLSDYWWLQLSTLQDC